LLVADLGLQAERSAGVAREREALISAGLVEVQTSSKPNIDSVGDRIALKIFFHFYEKMLRSPFFYTLLVIILLGNHGFSASF
jgi:hypothetical protein